MSDNESIASGWTTSLLYTATQFLLSLNPSYTPTTGPGGHPNDQWPAWFPYGTIVVCHKYPWFSNPRTLTQKKAILVCSVPANKSSKTFLCTVVLTFEDNPFGTTAHLAIEFGILNDDVYVSCMIGGTQYATTEDFSGFTSDETKLNAAQAYVTSLVQNQDIAQEFLNQSHLAINQPGTLPALLLDAMNHTGIKARLVIRG
ncbi:hypothetical protein QFC20_003777 [Naganishia adeliensis]|uniref:Uncharacterized protein n=1 Tax=Naganishia adeliensis TaxID=92952 RepID=A0ACC2W6I0_9TREE|nr:hypothetical protein QFC20_003777 [Naganishia adeliensis]